MKLIRLTSTENRAMFDNTLNDPINLPSNAQVALSNVALASKARSVVIGADNGVVTWTTNPLEGPGYDHSITLEPGLYNASNEETFLKGMEADLNDAQSTAEWSNSSDEQVSALMMNTQWAVVENKGGASVPGQSKKLPDDHKIVIGYRKSCTSAAGETSSTDPTIPASLDFVTDNVTLLKGGNHNKFYRTASSGNEASSLAGKTPMGWGPGGFAMSLDKISDDGVGLAAVQGVFFGLTSTNHAAAASAPTRAECKFGIHCSYQGQNYKIYKNNVITDGGDSILATAKVLIRRNQGVYEAYFNDDGPLTPWTQLTGELEYTYRDNATNPLYPVVIIYGALAHTEAGQMSYSPDPYLFMTLKKGVPSIHSSLWDEFSHLGVPNNSVNLQINLSQDVGTYLGFLSGGLGDFRFPSGPPAGRLELVSRDSFGWKANRSFAVVGRSESFYVQLLSAGCEGYDGLKHGRENILAVIPKSDDSNQLLYDVANPLFLEVGNAFPITLRNISARVLTEDGGELATDGLSVMTLLFK